MPVAAPPRLLCVEDEQPLLTVLSMALTHHGFEVVKATNGIDALAQYLDHGGSFTAIITDHDMPDLNGLEFIRQARGAGFTREIFLMSGRLAPSDLLAYGELGINGFLQKPFGIDALIRLLRKTIVSEDKLV